jgi:DNA repair exonuclease SbcCD ATPase subunit
MPEETIDAMEQITENVANQGQAVTTETKPLETPPVDAKKEYEEKINGLNSEIERLKKRTENQQKFFDRIGTEVGLLRKQLPEEEKKELEAVRDAFSEDPIKGMAAYKEYEAKTKERENLINKVQVNEQSSKVRDNLISLAKDFDTKIDEIADLLKEDGASVETIRQYKENPYVYGEEINLNLYKRTLSKSELKKIALENDTLKKENEALKKKSGEIFENIEKASNSTPISSKATSPSISDVNILKKDPWSMSRAELKQVKVLIKQT